MIMRCLTDLQPQRITQTTDRDNGLRELGRWMLGFRGHFVTKSRRYSTNRGHREPICVLCRRVPAGSGPFRT